MDALPDLLARAVGDATVIDTIEIGGGDTIVVTHETTYVYRSDGLLKDESVETFEHAVERLSVRTKRRKHSIQFETIDSEESFTVPAKIIDDVLEAMVQGILLTNGTVDPDEELLSLFRFSELTLVITDRRLFQHIGGAVWDDDFEAVEYDELSGLDFERGSVATQVVLETHDRRRRVKVPNEHAGTVRRVVRDAVFAFRDIDSLEQLRTEDSSDPKTDEAAESDAEDAPETAASTDADNGASPDPEDSFVSAGWSPPGEADASDRTDDGQPQQRPANAATEHVDENAGTGVSNGAEVTALSERVETLSQQIEQQTELIESQQELIEQLVDELRRGR
jgi:hypothetical protein